MSVTVTVRHRVILRAVLAIVMVLAGCRSRETSEPAGGVPSGARPNVVLLIIDTLRADRLGCYGHPADTSPELDALAKGGVQFDQVVAQCSWTRPSIGSMLTSRYPRSIGIYDEGNEILDDRFTLLSEVLQAHGYETLGITANTHLNRSFNFDQGFARYVDSNRVYAHVKPHPSVESTDLATARAVFATVLKLVGKERGDSPYYVQINIMDVHTWHRGDRFRRRAYRALFQRTNDKRYLQAVRQVSADTAAFLDRLLALPGWEDTLVVITSDHGEGLWDHPHVSDSLNHGRLLYESQLRVPLILHRPGWEYAGRRISRPVRLLDVMPTVLDIAGVPIPDHLDGVSVLPLVESPEASLPLAKFFVAETELREHSKASVYSAEWKYIESYNLHQGIDRRELQRMGIKEDGRRTNRLVQHPEIAEELGRHLSEWKREFPRVAPTVPEEQISPEELEQLKALGYLQ